MRSRERGMQKVTILALSNLWTTPKILAKEFQIYLNLAIQETFVYNDEKNQCVYLILSRVFSNKQQDLSCTKKTTYRWF